MQWYLYENPGNQFRKVTQCFIFKLNHTPRGQVLALIRSSLTILLLTYLHFVLFFYTVLHRQTKNVKQIWYLCTFNRKEIAGIWSIFLTRPPTMYTASFWEVPTPRHPSLVYFAPWRVDVDEGAGAQPCQNSASGQNYLWEPIMTLVLLYSVHPAWIDSSEPGLPKLGIMSELIISSGFCL